MKTSLVVSYVDKFGELINQPERALEVEKLLLSVPDPETFERIRTMFYQKFHNPLLTTFLNELTPDHHVRILNAYRHATRDYY